MLIEKWKFQAKAIAQKANIGYLQCLYWYDFTQFIWNQA